MDQRSQTTDCTKSGEVCDTFSEGRLALQVTRHGMDVVLASIFDTPPLGVVNDS